MYLKHNIKIAPYIWNWYAWSHLISPHTAAMNIADRHIKIMESFVAYPEMHYEAIHSKGLVGGPFINLHPDRKAIILNLLEQTKIDCRNLIQLSNAIKEFDLFLQKNADGKSLESFYPSLPNLLQGMVELVYDLHNHPNLRFIEPLLYNKYYDSSQQSLVLSVISDDLRPFCLSTPHIEQDDTLELKIPFASSLVDELMKMKINPGDPNRLGCDLSIKKEQLDFYHNLFTDTPPARCNPEYKESGIRVRYFGHACVLVQTSQVSVLVDPALGYSYADNQVDRFTVLDLPDVIDYVLISHNHQDHFLFEVLLQLRYRIKNIVVPSSNEGALEDPSMKLVLKSLGFTNIHTISPFDEICLGNAGKITALPFLGEHGDLDIRTKAAYHMVLQDMKFIFLADSNNLDPMLYDHIFDYIGFIDILFIGMECVGAPVSWLYGPVFSTSLNREHDRSRRLSGSNFDKAAKIVKRFKCKEVYVYAMGMEPWLSYIMAVDYKPDSFPIIESDKLIASCRSEHIKSERLYGKKEWIFPRGGNKGA